MFDWPYYVIRQGMLFEEIPAEKTAFRRCVNYRRAFAYPSYNVPAAPLFTGEYAVMEAEDWLHTYDQRGTVKRED